jgi:Raf kinase inhibitor-like YbhB/YbcL family protein
MRLIFLSTFALFLLCACHTVNHNHTSSTQNNNIQSGKDNMTLPISSSAFANGSMIPSQYTCDGVNISPPLQWSGSPVAAKTFALIVDDPDAPAKTWVHWVVYDLPANATQLTENIGQAKTLGSGGKQGTNDFKRIGYGGPCPPSGTHRYFFKLYAVDIETSLPPGATKDELLKAIDGHVVAQGEVVGKYKR